MPNLIPQLEHFTLQTLLSIYSEIADFLTFEDYVKFIELVQILKPTVTLSLLPDEAGPLITFIYLSMGSYPKRAR